MNLSNAKLICRGYSTIFTSRKDVDASKYFGEQCYQMYIYSRNVIARKSCISTDIVNTSLTGNLTENLSHVTGY